MSEFPEGPKIKGEPPLVIRATVPVMVFGQELKPGDTLEIPAQHDVELAARAAARRRYRREDWWIVAMAVIGILMVLVPLVIKIIE